MSQALTVEAIADLTPATRAAIDELESLVYPPEMMANWPGRDIEWANAEWCVRVPTKNGTLASFVGLVRRTVKLDGRSVNLGGIGSVKTHPKARRQGCAARGLQRSLEFFREQGDVELVQLICEPALVDYYGRFGFQPFQGKVLVRQRGQMEEFTFNQTQLLGLRGPAPTHGTLDLCGPPW